MALSTSDIIELCICCVTFSFYLYWLYCLAKSKKFSPVFSVIQMMILLDAASVLVKTIHDYACKYYDEEVFHPIMVEVCMFVQCIRWYGQLFLIPILALFHFWTLYSPLSFRNVTRKFVYELIGGAMIISLAFTIPLLTECCGFIFYIQGYYWNYDVSKESYTFYTYSNWALQILAMGSIILSDVYLISRLRTFASKRQHRIISVSQSVLSNAGTISAHVADSTKEVDKAKARKTPWLTSELRISIAFMYFSIAFTWGTLHFNWLSNFKGPVWSIINYVRKFLDYTKLGNYVIMSNIRK